VKHYNATLVESARRIFNPKAGDMMSGDVMPDIAVTKELIELGESIGSNVSAATGTLSVTPLRGTTDCYITEVAVSFTKNVTCDVASGAVEVRVIVNSVVRTLLRMAVLTLTAERDSAVLHLSHPLKIDRGTTIDFSGAFTAGAMVRAISVVGFYTETTVGV